MRSSGEWTRARSCGATGPAGTGRRRVAAARTGRRWRHLICAGVVAAGCSNAPTLQITTNPAAVEVYLDGARRPGTLEEKSPLPYYGTATISGHVPRSLRYQECREQIPLDEPFSPWLFPADFLLEFVTAPFAAERYDHRAQMTSPQLPEPAVGTTPPDMPALRERATQARRRR